MAAGFSNYVTPAKAGVPLRSAVEKSGIPAFAGMTGQGDAQ
jgi:hypothetical protein